MGIGGDGGVPAKAFVIVIGPNQSITKQFALQSITFVGQMNTVGVGQAGFISAGNGSFAASHGKEVPYRQLVFGCDSQDLVAYFTRIGIRLSN